MGVISRVVFLKLQQGRGLSLGEGAVYSCIQGYNLVGIEKIVQGT